MSQGDQDLCARAQEQLGQREQVRLVVYARAGLSMGLIILIAIGACVAWLMLILGPNPDAPRGVGAFLAAPVILAVIRLLYWEHAVVITDRAFYDFKVSWRRNLRPEPRTLPLDVDVTMRRNKLWLGGRPRLLLSDASVYPPLEELARLSLARRTS